MAEENYTLAINKLYRAVRKTLARDVEVSVRIKIQELEKQVSELTASESKKTNDLDNLIELAKNMVSAQNGKAKARRDAAKMIEILLDELKPVPEALKSKNIAPVVGSFKRKRRKKSANLDR